MVQASFLATVIAVIISGCTVSARGVMVPRAYCTNGKQVVEGNTCEIIADRRCTISVARLQQLNPQLDCSNLRVGQHFCCNEGAVRRDPECTNYKTVVAGNTCASIADKRCTISESRFRQLNPHLDCSNLQVGTGFCCSEGSLPLPDCTNVKTVVEGNTCAIIADRRCTISLGNFVNYNPHIDCSRLEVGEKVCCMEGKLPEGPSPNADGTCQDRQVVPGDSCSTLYQKCNITPSLLTQYNTATNFCSNLKVNQWICCSSGTLKDRRPKPNADGSCATYTVKAGDSCSVIEAANGLVDGDLDTFNKRKTWGWAGCSKLWPDSKICLSSGTPPMPLPIANAVCGPQKPGTVAPPAGTNISTLNPCPLNTCCNIWGQCGTTKDFCEVTGDGTPGTGTCISNCGMTIVNNNAPPAEYKKIGYFEAWSTDRDCLWMDATSIDETQFTHIHFAFADVTPDFRVDVSKVQAQFNKFKALKRSKRIIAFGGWAASTSPTTFQIFRAGVNSANRATLANNIANFVREHGLDGADIDWEYPAAPDLPDIPPADPIDGPNYLAFLRLLRAGLPTGKSLAIAAPASYWYLKGFPVREMGSVLDYIVYMTYDLHGQWDAGSRWSQDGCPSGMCLRSHVNMTETYNALVMVTKAGVPANKIIVGVSSYGRSFKMKDPNCRGPMCEYTGTASVSHATPGPCTGVQGYISNAEIQEYKNVNDINVATHYDQATRSNIAIINGTWIAYMDTAEKNARSNMYRGWNFGGTSDWAIDLNTFTELERKVSGSVLTNRFTRKGATGGSTRWYDLSCSIPAVDTADMDRKQRWEGLMADEAWADAIKAYLARTMDVGSFSSWIVGKFFRGRQDVHCGTLLPASNCLSPQENCYDKDNKPPILTNDPPERTGPAGKFIMNSFVTLEQLFVNYYDALREAQQDVDLFIPVMEDYFMKEFDDTFAKQMGYNILAAITSLVTGPLVGHVLRNSGATEVVDQAVLATVMTFKDKNTGDIEDDLSKASTLAMALNATMTHWERSVTGFSARLFAGPDKDGHLTPLLANFMAEGKLIGGGVPKEQPRPDILRVADMKDMIRRALFTFMIPVAWNNNDDANVAVLETGNACRTYGNLWQRYVREEDAKKAEFCFENKQYLLLAAMGPYQNCYPFGTGGGQSCDHAFWSLPPGFDKLGEFNNISATDIMEGALRTWRRNGGQNGYEFDPDNLAVKDYYDPVDPMRNKIIDMGLIQFPVCTLDQANLRWGHPGPKGDFYPC
ncbi:hypothetical protein QC763_608160 [Podospora pseudopauciseta]|uniref:chitinase n=1 Tax=Podospora pseudopauciseta TaxID=2093780 RepID=A0ABR0H691_9PEZI|nr:hypothetical protein QC763_608160 [Podospora pseudopauciseta]